MDEIEQKKEEPKLEIKDNLDNISSENAHEEDNNNKITEETLIVSDNKSKSKNSNENSSSPLIEDNNIYSNNNKLKDDHYIFIERTKCLKIPYFIFGFTTHFYFPSKKLQTKMKLSEIPNPPFTLGPDCKFVYIINIKHLIFYIVLFQYHYVLLAFV